MSKLLEIFKNRDLIWEGLRNKMFKREHVEAVYEERMKICRGCESFDTSGKGCAIKGTQPCCNQNNGGCGCSLSIKARSLGTDCPKKKWLAVTTEQEDAMIQHQINETKSKGK